MSAEKTILATDLEDFDEVDVVEVLVSPGEQITKGQSIVTLESDKAMMEFPSSESGVIKDIAVNVGDKIKQGDTLATITIENVSDAEQAAATDSTEQETAAPTADKPKAKEAAIKNTESKEIAVTATDLEDFDEIDVVEVLVKPGDHIEKEQSIVTLESDKAMMEFPSPYPGVVKSIAVEVGGKVKQGDTLITLTTSVQQDVESTASATQSPKSEPLEAKSVDESIQATGKPSQQNISDEHDAAYASPAVRKYANELGVDLTDVSGSGNQGRIRKQDVQSYVSKQVNSGGSGSPIAAEPLPDFSQFGPTEEVALNKLRQISAQRLAYSWQIAPHVTQFDDADVTELDRARKQLKSQLEEQNIKLTMLPFIMKALVKCLAEFPDFNSSINPTATALVHKKYFHIGIAVDTPRGLVVPVIKDVDQKKIPEIAQELMDISSRARDGKLSPKEMQGGCMSITNVGSFGGQHFTPILNQPEVAILGISRGKKQLVKLNGEIDERLMLPLSLSYDHRAIDGVAAVKFITSLKNKLSDVWSLML